MVHSLATIIPFFSKDPNIPADPMPCALCFSMFHNLLRTDLHHTSLENLRKAAHGGRKVCINLVMRQETHGPDIEGEGAAYPFLRYR